MNAKEPFSSLLCLRKSYSCWSHWTETTTNHSDANDERSNKIDWRRCSVLQELMERVEEICPAHTPQQDTEELKAVKQK